MTFSPHQNVYFLVKYPNYFLLAKLRVYLVPSKFLGRASAFPLGGLEGTGWVAWEAVLPHGEGWKPSDRCVLLPAFPCSSGVMIRSCQDGRVLR